MNFLNKSFAGAALCGLVLLAGCADTSRIEQKHSKVKVAKQKKQFRVKNAGTTTGEKFALIGSSLLGSNIGILFGKIAGGVGCAALAVVCPPLAPVLLKSVGAIVVVSGLGGGVAGGYMGYKSCRKIIDRDKPAGIITVRVVQEENVQAN